MLILSGCMCVFATHGIVVVICLIEFEIVRVLGFLDIGQFRRHHISFPYGLHHFCSSPPMNRRRSTPGTMGPPSDRDVVMGPPPVPTPLSSGLPAPLPQQKPKDDQNLAEKYKKLKRRFFELEEVSVNIILFLLMRKSPDTVLTQKHKETNNELQRSGERNVRMREERECVQFSGCIALPRIDYVM